MSKVVYLLCLAAGAAFAYMSINLPEKEQKKTEVEVKIPEPILVKDTIFKTETKWRTVYKTKCCCEHDVAKHEQE